MKTTEKSNTQQTEVKQRVLNGKLVGDCTGFCYSCGSKELWGDNVAYGCKKCGKVRILGIR